MEQTVNHYENIKDEQEAALLFQRDMEEVTGSKIKTSTELKEAEGCCRQEQVEMVDGDIYLISVSWTRINKGNSRNYRCIAKLQEKKNDKEQLDLFAMGG